MVSGAQRSGSQKWDGGSLRDVSNRVRNESHEGGAVHLSDEHLLAQPSEDALRNHAGFGGRVRKFALRQQTHGRRSQSFKFGCWKFQRLSGPSLLPHQRGRMSIEIAFSHVEDLARSQPVPLIIGNEETSVFVEPKSFRGAKTARKWLPATAIRRNLQDPPTVRDPGIHAACTTFVFSPPGSVQHILSLKADRAPLATNFLANAGTVRGCAQREVYVALLILCEAEGELMIVPRHSEIIEDCLVEVCDSVAIGVLDSGQLRALHDQKAGVALGNDTKWFVQACGKLLPRVGLGAVDKDFTAMKTCRKFAAGCGCNSTDLRVYPGRRRHFFYAEGVGPYVSRGETRGEND